MCFNLMKIMETSFNLRLPAIALFLLLLCLHLRLLPALPLNHMVTADLVHEEQNGKEAMAAKTFPNSGEPGSKHEIEVVKKHGGGGAEPAAHGRGGEHGNAGNGGGDNGRGSGGQIPVYAAGSMNHNRDHQHHGSNGGTINGFCSSCLALIIFASISVYSI